MPAAADRTHLAFLQHAQQLDLQRRRRLADLVEEHGAAVRLLEDALAYPRCAPVNAPRAWPKSSDSSSVSVSAPQLIGTNGARARRPCAWIARATSSLPVPLSPMMSTGAAALAACAICL